MKKLVFLRRASQVFFFCLFVYALWAMSHLPDKKRLAEIFFRTDPLAMFAVSISARVWLFGALWAGFMLGAAFVLGRFFCGWICPLGALFDCAAVLKKRKKHLRGAQNRKMRLVKFYILTGILLCAAFGFQIVWVFDPIVIVARFVSLNLIPALGSAVDKVFVFLIQTFNLYGKTYDVYQNLRFFVLGEKIFYFTGTFVIFTFFFLIVAAAAFLSRWWCRMICPLGALYAVFSKRSLLKRVVAGCVDCGRCQNICRMGAIEDDMETVPGECILCMDCLYACSPGATKFAFVSFLPKKPPEAVRQAYVEKKNAISRSDFLIFLISTVSFFGFSRKFPFVKSLKRNIPLRPPGVKREKDFLDRCIRCGNCMRACPTNVLQPVVFQSGFKGIWTPNLVYDMGYCEYNCSACGQVCPTSAIPNLSLDKKQKEKIGVARVDRSTCIAWRYKQKCIVCQEHCPVSEKAIKLVPEDVGGRIVYKPIVDPSMCIGCGICQNKCPVRPVRAIKVTRLL